MKQTNLEKLYTSIETLTGMGIELPEEVLRQTAELEEQLIRKEVLPAIRDNIEPSLRQIHREMTLVVDYRPEEPISVRISRKRDLSDLSEATLLTPDEVPGIKRRSPQQRTGQRRPNTKLKVTTSEGRLFYDAKHATNTFCDVLEFIGLMRVRQLEIMPSGINLVSTSKDENRQQRKIGDFYIFTNRSTDDKAKMLSDISNRLHLGLKVEVVG